MARQDPDDPRTAPAERVVAGSLIDDTGVGRPLSRRSAQRQRSVESYLRGEALPRYIQRAAQIERETREHLRRLREQLDVLRRRHPGDRAGLEAAWRELVSSWSFRGTNALIRQHNEWYPVERDLPMDPRTGDYVPVNGRSFRREELDAAWALARVPLADDRDGPRA